MRVLIEQDDGAIIEAKEIEGISATADVLLFFVNCFMRRIEETCLEEVLSEKTGKKCVVLNSSIEKVVGIPGTASRDR